MQVNESPQKRRRTYPVIDDIDSLVFWEMLFHHVLYLAMVDLDDRAAASFQALECGCCGTIQEAEAFFF